ncbi:hypothetical protein [Alsobacter sp. SYSU BS001988]|jgi:hypothetical protein
MNVQYMDWLDRPAVAFAGSRYVLADKGLPWTRLTHAAALDAAPLSEDAFRARFGDWDLPPLPRRGGPCFHRTAGPA